MSLLDEVEKEIQAVANSTAIAHQYIGYQRGQLSRLEYRINLLNFSLIMMGLAMLIHFYKVEG
jgi:hypothetical protein